MNHVFMPIHFNILVEGSTLMVKPKPNGVPRWLGDFIVKLHINQPR